MNQSKFQNINTNNNNEIERSLLAHSHTDERVAELLKNRYSMAGDQKPILVLTPTGTPSTTGGKTEIKIGAKSSNNGPDSGKIGNQLVVPIKRRKINARSDLRRYIIESQKSQRLIEHKLKQHLTAKSQPTIEKKIPKSKPATAKTMSTGESDINLDEALLLKIIRSAGTSIPRYEQFLPLNKLWQGYIRTLIYSGNSGCNGNPNNGNNKNNNMMAASKLISADYHGALLCVKQASNPSVTGTKGIVIWEAKTCFVMVVASDLTNEFGVKSTRSKVGGLRIIQKKGSKFEFTISNKSDIETAGDKEETTGDKSEEAFTIIGSRFLYRSVDRSGRKFKGKSVEDL
ncbi:RNase P/MRP, p29 subunit [Nadsonia fulvescens var. elongata DSM 6958]|uniref:RNase P/MRP, p29 subunit n=1 Tax=Nadsonia fulvescens var. elongata DSM 6958 TaxID=857566 RepID=A0A1E3PSL0_9ASCO|nr:RNase P/MRP, p29 subunit [Nadsonia fulvescens var. elongata DSM 6958]